MKAKLSRLPARAARLSYVPACANGGTPLYTLAVGTVVWRALCRRRDPLNPLPQDPIRRI
jgi:hypothetical protein